MLGVEKEKAETAAKKIADLRDDKKLPFPDFHPQDISSFERHRSITRRPNRPCASHRIAAGVIASTDCFT